VIGTVGRLSDVKRQDLLLRALVRLPDARLLVVGDGPLRAELEELSRQLRVADRVQWAGFQADVMPFLSAMDVFALPSRFEGMPLAILEAWRSGLPVVASRVGGLPEMIRDGDNGLLFEEGNLDELTQALARLLADAPLRQELAHAGRQELQHRFGSQRMARSYDRYYRTAA
jgi:glycosyltransferase involved in cell wall biosynthesis